MVEHAPIHGWTGCSKKPRHRPRHAITLFNNPALFREKPMSTQRSAYLSLLKQCLSGQIYDPGQGPEMVTRAQAAALLREANTLFAPWLAPSGDTVESFLGATTASAQASFAEQLSLSLNRMHRDRTADTMADRASIDHLHTCVEHVLRHDVPGDLIETGIWKGGLTVLMRGILQAHDSTDRVVWAADSFQGLPRPDAGQNLKDAIWFHLFSPLDGLSISYEYVRAVFRKYRLLDDQVRFLRGWFADTLPAVPIGQLAVMRLDGDWYESTRLALEVLYPKLSPGGFVIIDDYGLPFGCRQAVDEYRAACGIVEPVQWVNHQVVCWQKAG
jgi:hypothetical protein